VLTFAEAVDHPHAIARGAFLQSAGVPMPAPAPRFARTPTGIPTGPAEHLDTPIGDMLSRWS
jgi:alpha-methylacyl-CoA racemase